MNVLLEWAQGHLDRAQELLVELGDDLTEQQVEIIRTLLEWVDYYINEFYKEQQK